MEANLVFLGLHMEDDDVVCESMCIRERSIFSQSPVSKCNYKLHLLASPETQQGHVIVFFPQIDSGFFAWGSFIYKR